MKRMNRINLNDKVRVKLRDEGIQVLARQHKELRKQIQSEGGRDIGEFVLILQPGGYYETQLWNLIRKFSENMKLTADNVFEGNNLYFMGEQQRRKRMKKEIDNTMWINYEYHCQEMAKLEEENERLEKLAYELFLEAHGDKVAKWFKSIAEALSNEKDR